MKSFIRSQGQFYLLTTGQIYVVKISLTHKTVLVTNLMHRRNSLSNFFMIENGYGGLSPLKKTGGKKR